MKEEQEKLLRYIGDIFEQRRLQKETETGDCHQENKFQKFPEALNHKIIKAGKKIRILREKKSMSVETLAALADLTPLYVTQIEIGEADPYMMEIYDLSKALGVELSYLFEDV